MIKTYNYEKGDVTLNELLDHRKLQISLNIMEMQKKKNTVLKNKITL